MTSGSSEKENFEYVKTALSRYANLRTANLHTTLSRITIDERTLIANYGGFGSSILVRGRSSSVSGSRDTFVFAVPMTSLFAVETALALTAEIQNRDNPINIIVAFLGDERIVLPPEISSIPSHLSMPYKGLRDLLTQNDLPENWSLCYFDAVEEPTKLVLHHTGRAYIAPLELIKPLPAIFSPGISWSFATRQNSIKKDGQMDAVEASEILSIAWLDEINGIVLSGQSEGKTSGQSSRFSAYLSTILKTDLNKGDILTHESIAKAILEYSSSLNFPIINPDRHYTFIPLPSNNYFFITERLTVSLLLILAGIFLFIYLVYSSGNNAILFFHFRFFLRYSWLFLLLLPIQIICFKLSGVLYSFLLELFKAPKDAEYLSGITLAILLALAFCFFILLLLDLLNFPKRTRFYGISAVFFGILGMFFAFFMDFTYAIISFCSFIFIFICASITNPVIMFSLSLTIPAFAFFRLMNIAELGSGRLAELFIMSDFSYLGSIENWISLIQPALLILPFLLLIKRGLLLLRKLRKVKRPRKKIDKYRLIIFPCLIFSIIIAIIIHILIVKQIDPSGRRYVTDLGGNESSNYKLIDLSVQDTVFQDSRIINLQLAANNAVTRFDLTLESINGKSLLPLYSSPVPFERVNNGEKILFSLGEFPPNPLNLEIVLPLEFEGLIKTTAVYNSWDQMYPVQKSQPGEYFLLASKSAELKATSGNRQ